MRTLVVPGSAVVDSPENGFHQRGKRHVERYSHSGVTPNSLIQYVLRTPDQQVGRVVVLSRSKITEVNALDRCLRLRIFLLCFWFLGQRSFLCFSDTPR